ncbi:MAG TPA: cyclase family protein [Solirubrobacterales bacterium]|nr:cyclase family protein [Solirubrobacterales bacterium]
MKLIDISRPLDARMPGWPGETPFHREQTSSVGGGDAATVSNLVGCAHTGTHVDAPAHFIADGAGLGELPLEPWIGRCRVVRHGEDRDVTAADLDGWGLEGVERLLLRTENASRWDDAPEFREDYLAIDAGAARWIVDHGLKLIGIDYLSIETFEGGDFPVHRTLLGAEVAILEGIRLDHVEPGDYELIALPLPVADGDGSPVRAILRTLDGGGG